MFLWYHLGNCIHQVQGESAGRWSKGIFDSLHGTSVSLSVKRGHGKLEREPNRLRTGFLHIRLKCYWNSLNTDLGAVPEPSGCGKQINKSKFKKAGQYSEFLQGICPGSSGKFLSKLAFGDRGTDGLPLFSPIQFLFQALKI